LSEGLRRTNANANCQSDDDQQGSESHVSSE
jgi:hypothetical protein